MLEIEWSGFPHLRVGENQTFLLPMPAVIPFVDFEMVEIGADKGGTI